MANTDNFREYLQKLFEDSRARGAVEITLRAGSVHRAIGGYPGTVHRMPALCNAMRESMRKGDVIISTPPRGADASLTIRYGLKEA